MKKAVLVVYPNQRLLKEDPQDVNFIDELYEVRHLSIPDFETALKRTCGCICSGIIYHPAFWLLDDADQIDGYLRTRMREVI